MTILTFHQSIVWMGRLVTARRCVNASTRMMYKVVNTPRMSQAYPQATTLRGGWMATWNQLLGQNRLQAIKIRGNGGRERYLSILIRQHVIIW